jgi:RNA polymerase sigma-70 factor (ECF subfamily)
MPAPRLTVVAGSGGNAVLDAARAGDEQAFVRLTAPHRRALHVHCYRLLGSLDDADDALQETLLRAWRGVARFEPRGSLGGWLHRIATNVCLRMIEQRAASGGGEPVHLQPYPDRLLEGLPAREPGPAAQAELREGIGLAFVTALQLLPARQRAVLLLRDVLGWSARDAAELLGYSVPAVNSALQRARERIRREPDAEKAWARVHAPASASAEAELMRRFQAAWAAVDIEAMVALLAPDALLTMPPERARIAGAAAVGGFFATVPLDGRLDRITLVEARANGQPATAAYAEDEDGRRRAYGVMVFAVRGDRIAGITGFPRRPDLFTRLGLPTELGAR